MAFRRKRRSRGRRRRPSFGRRRRRTRRNVSSKSRGRRQVIGYRM